MISVRRIPWIAVLGFLVAALWDAWKGRYLYSAVYLAAAAGVTYDYYLIEGRGPP